MLLVVLVVFMYRGSDDTPDDDEWFESAGLYTYSELGEFLFSSCKTYIDKMFILNTILIY